MYFYAIRPIKFSRNHLSRLWKQALASSSFHGSSGCCWSEQDKKATRQVDLPFLYHALLSLSISCVCSQVYSADTQYSQGRLSRLSITNVQFCRRPVGLLQALYISGCSSLRIRHLGLCVPIGCIRWEPWGTSETGRPCATPKLCHSAWWNRRVSQIVRALSLLERLWY